MSIKIVKKSECLLTLLREELSALGNDQVSESIVILPTQRLSQYLLELLKRENLLVPPTVVTLDSFISRFSQTGKNDVVLLPHISEWVMSSLISECRFRHIQKGHAHEICELFSQLEDGGSKYDFFDSLKNIIRTDVYRDEQYVDSLWERVDELATLCERFYSALEKRNILTTGQRTMIAMESLTERWTDSDRLPWYKVFFAGFTTARTNQKKFLRFLARKKNVQFLLSDPPVFVGTVNPLKDFLDSLGGMQKSSETSGERGASAQPCLVKEQCLVFEADSLSSETDIAFSMLDSCIEKGIPPARIGLLVSDERAYGPYIEHALAKRNLPVNLAVTSTFPHTSPGSWLLALCKMLEHPEDNSFLKQVLFHPLSKEALKIMSDEESEDMFDYMVTINAALSFTILWREQIFEDLRLLNLFKHLKELLHPVFENKRRTVTEWQLEFQKLGMELLKTGTASAEAPSREAEEITSDALVNRLILVYPSVSPAEQKACKELFDSLQQWGTLWNDKVTCQEFFKAVADKIKNLETHTIGFPHTGVQILNIVEARYVPFEVIIVLGCNEGRFPKGLPSDRLIDDSLKVKAGLSGWRYIEALEDTTFHLLCTQAQHYAFLYNRADASSRSRFLERLLTIDQASFLPTLSGRPSDSPGPPPLPTHPCYPKPTCHSGPRDRRGSTPAVNSDPSMTLEVQLRSFDRPQPFSSSEAGDFKPERRSLFATVSASSLENLFSCPYRFLLSKLGVKERGDDPPALWEGRWLHQILEAFFTGSTEEKALMDPLPLPLRLANDSILSFAQERLETLSKLILPENVRQTPFYLHLVHFAWPRFAEHWRKFFEPCGQETSQLNLSRYYKEYPLSVERHLLNHENVSTRITGKIDSVNVLGQGFILSDYKRKRTDSVKDVNSGQSPQLPLYALALEHDLLKDREAALDHGLTGYWSILDGQWHARGLGENIRSWAVERKLATTQTPSLKHQAEKLRKLWEEACRNFLKEEKPFIPTPGKHCDTCSFSSICRKNDL
ncbi:MAG: exodeoxyribonuclease V subunit gamma [Deltaproteobacteria bacterium]|nr:exodeoxyribonuclease V subunit gamma [Deltaproteobacteria bacterium]